MAQIQGGHCPWSKIQGGQPTTLTPPCRAPVPSSLEYPNTTLAHMHDIEFDAKHCILEHF